jgi:hypothetical protein
MIRFRCTSCKYQLQTADANAGKKATCPKCQKVVIVPAPVREAPKLRPDPLPSNPPPAPVRANPLASPWLIGTAGFCVLAVGILVGVLATRKKSEPESDRSDGPLVVQPTPAQKVGKAAGDPVPVDPPTPAPPPPQTKSPPKSGPGWVDAGQVVVRDSVQVRITTFSVGKVPLKTITGNSRSEDPLLMIRLELLNNNPTKKVEYSSWAGRSVSFDRDFATLKDNFDNRYKRIYFRTGSHPVGSVERSESIYPNKSITDVLVFEVPLDTATHLDLELPAKNFGGEGMILFRIPTRLLTRE